MAASELTVLNRKRRNIKGQITKLGGFVASEDEHNEAVVSARIETLEKLQCRFEELKTEYYRTVKDEEFEETEQFLSEIDDDLQRLEVSLKSLLHDLKIKPDRPNNLNNPNPEKSNNDLKNVAIKLPEIPLPLFTGKFEDWSTFKTQFNNLIDENPSLSDNQKLYYLRASLKDEAKYIESSDDTYNSLFKALLERYENKRVIVDTHIKSIINQEKLIQESAKDLRKLLDCIKKNLRALKILTFERNNFSNILLMNIILQKLDRETRKQYELTLENNDVPDFDEFLEFLERRCQVLDSINRNVSFKPKYAFPKDQSYKTKNFFVNSFGNNPAVCMLCKNSSHLLYKCEAFLKLSPEKRYEIVREYKLCMNCLGHHKVAFCRSKYKCKECSSKHHSLLHRTNLSSASGTRNCAPELSNVNKNSAGVLESPDVTPPQNLCPQTLTSCFVAEKKKVILATAIIDVLDRNGVYIKGRACLDSGSQCNMMTTHFANILGLREEKIHVPVCGLAGCPITVKRKTTAVISNSEKSFSAALEFLIIPKITDMMPAEYLDLNEIQIPSNLQLADVLFFQPSKVDLLVGCEIFFDLLKTGKIRIANSLVLHNSVFGYLVTGAVPGAQKIQYCGFLTQMDNLEDTVKKFWELEAVLDPLSLKTKEELECEEHFLKTHRRDEKGKYVVSLPMKANLELGDSILSAKQRLNNLWIRLDKNPKMSSLYTTFMAEYEQLGHMKEIENASPENVKYVMPHHGIYKENSSTTKLRVVFDASASSTNGLSLNNYLLNGGIVQEDIFSILMRFRTHKFVFTADVKKMYRQIWVNPDQCNMQCILWKKGSKEEAKLYKLLTVTYGTKSAPFLATRVLKQLAIDEQFNYPLASAATLTDFYVDDILSGAEDIPTAIQLQQQLSAMLNSGGMELHKWCSNEKTLLEHVPFGDQEYHFDDSDKDTVKTLGLRWNPKEDSFSFTVSPCSNILTKRSVLGEISRIFDPLGVVGAVIVQAKIFLQKLWLLKMDWDQELPLQEKRKWEKFQKALPELRKVQINRYVLTNPVKEIQIIGFSDASKDAFGAVVYIRCVTVSHEVTVNLLCSKSRVAPIKVVTIPRLELCAAELLSKLVSKTLAALNLKISRVYLFTDSTIVLSWIESSPHLLKVFVSNRISRIREITKNFHWQHVKTADNPADLISRGVSPDQIIDNRLWWHGPEFLQQETIELTGGPYSTSDENYIQEFKKVADITLTLSVNDAFVDSVLSITNNYSKLIRIVSFIFRFAHNIRKPLSKIQGHLSIQELKNSCLFLVRCVQEREFGEDINNLRKGKSPTGKIRNLNPYLDNNNILRVGGRLRHCKVSDAQKHPIVLPAKHELTKMIIVHYHKKYLHVGPQNLLYCIRNEFWPLNGRTLCRKIVHNCITCFKARPFIVEQIMGDLPKERVNVNVPFNCTGVDFCGPFLIKYRGQRKGIFHKIYVCIFVCMVTKAVHFDIVGDLTSEAFIATLKRFFARRGKAQKMFSDNAKNFVSTNLELKRLHNLVTMPDIHLANYLASECIQWNFLPPRAPNFGGLWEAGVKSFKYHLKRVVGNSKLTYEEFFTIVLQIEGILNSRPLTPLSCDIDDLEVLTPGHFLIGRPISAITEPSFINVDTNRLNLWQRTTKMVHLIWKRWQNNYLNTLQQRNRWMISKNNLKIGDMVILKEDNLPSCKWIMGRVVEVFVGKDNHVRVVNVKTQNGVFKRSISKIAVLPLEK